LDALASIGVVPAASCNEPITLYGDGTQTRSFCYVDDLIDGFLRLMDSSDEISGPINLGNPGEFSMIELADAVKELTGSRSQLVHEPLPQDDPRQRQPDITRAREQLGWEPKVALREGLKPTIAYFEGLLAAPSRHIPAGMRESSAGRATFRQVLVFGGLLAGCHPWHWVPASRPG